MTFPPVTPRAFGPSPLGLRLAKRPARVLGELFTHRHAPPRPPISPGKGHSGHPNITPEHYASLSGLVVDSFF